MSFWNRTPAPPKLRTCGYCAQERREPQDFSAGLALRESDIRDGRRAADWKYIPEPPSLPRYAHCNECQRLKLCALCETRYEADSDRWKGNVCPACVDRYHQPTEDGYAPLRKAAAEILAQLGAVAPTAIDAQNTVELGTAKNGQPVTVSNSDRNRHVYMIGKTGSGKSSLLRNVIMQDLAAGRGVIYLDPHGDTAQQLLGYVPPDRLDDVVYFCPTDATCPAFNLLAADYPADKLTRDVVSAFRMFFGFDQNSAPRLSQLLTNTVLLLLLDRDHEPHSLAHVRRVLIDPDYRAEIVARCPHESVAQFWTLEFPRFPKDATLPVLNKFSDLLMPTSPMERLFSSTQNALDLRAIMDGGKILLVNLSKGELGESGAFLIGALIVTAVNQAALARSGIPEHERRDVFLYVDEFQNFVVDSFESILSEARKYRLNLTLAHQYLAQVPSNLRSAIFGNVAVSIALPISAEDATIIQREFASRTYLSRQTGQRYDIDTDLRRHCEAIRDGLSPKPGSPHLYYSKLAYQSVAWFDAFIRRNREPDPEFYSAGQWPTTEDLKLLPPLAGFVKINRADNVHRFTIHHPKEKPSDEIRRAILDRQRAEHEARKAPATTRTTTPQQPATPPPTEPEDFSF